MQFKPQPKNARRLDRRFLSLIILITGPISFLRVLYKEFRGWKARFMLLM